MSFTVVIPARFASTRLPGKLLLDLGGKPVLQHVYERAQESGAERVIVATDHDDIVDAVKKFSGEVVVTDIRHQSGTDRIAEVIDKIAMEDQTVVVNVQGDEPLIDPQLVKKVATNLEQYSAASIATACSKLDSVDDLVNPNIVKVVTDENGYALYFSRAPIPWHREGFAQLLTKGALDCDMESLGVCYFRHIGIYAYRAQFLRTYVKLPQSTLEKTEALEQLRALSNGYKIHVGETLANDAIGIDTQDDYEKAKHIIERS